MPDTATVLPNQTGVPENAQKVEYLDVYMRIERSASENVHTTSFLHMIAGTNSGTTNIR